MKQLTFLRKCLTIVLIGCAVLMPSYAQLSGTLKIVAEGAKSVALRVDTTDATGFRVEFKKTADADFVEVTDFAQSSVFDNHVFLAHNGLESATEYVYQVTPFDGMGDGTAVRDTITTLPEGLLAKLKFESVDENGWVSEELSTRKDSLINAEVAASGIGALGNALHLSPTRLPNGSVSQYASMFLDSMMYPYYNRPVNPADPVACFSYSELSYSFYFKNEDVEHNNGPRMLTVFGGHSGNSIAFYDDSLYLVLGYRAIDGTWSTRFFMSDAVHFPQDDVNWHHIAYTFEFGVSKLYLDGQLIITLDASDKMPLARIHHRYRDHWVNSTLGTIYSWHYGLGNTPPFSTGGDAAFSRQFEGMMDEFAFYSHALTEDEITNQFEVLQAEGTMKIIAEGATSIALKTDTTNAVGFKVEIKKTADAEFTEVTEFAKMSKFDNTDFLVCGGLESNTEYVVQFTPMGGAPGMAIRDTTTTLPSGILAQHKFESADANGWVSEELSGRKDSLINAEVGPSGIDELGNALQLTPTRLPNGSVSAYASMFLDSLMFPYFNRNVNPSDAVMAFSYSEMSYSFYFKNEDTEFNQGPRMLTVFGGHSGNALAFYDDSLYLVLGYRAMDNTWSTRFFMSDAVHFPQTDTDWHHLAYTFEYGVSNVYLDGTLIITLDASQKLPIAQTHQRYRDHWVNSTLGAIYSWHYGLGNTPPFSTGGDASFSRQFEGMMDEFTYYGSALTSAEIEALASVIEIPEATANVSLTAKSYESVALVITTTDADGYRVEYKKTADAEFTDITNDLTAGTGDTLLHSGLEENTQYTYQVIPYNAGGDGVSASANVTTLQFVSVPQTGSNAISLYPNPAKDQLFINLDSPAQIEIISITGESVFNKQLNGTQQIDVTKYAKGLYIVKIDTENESMIYKLLVE